MAARRTSPIRVRRAVIVRAHSRCEYCRAPEEFSLDTFTVDHIRPVSDAGGDELSNLAFACHNCNNRKQDAIVAFDPESGRIVPLYHPRRDHWNDHRTWSEDGLLRCRIRLSCAPPIANSFTHRCSIRSSQSGHPLAHSTRRSSRSAVYN